MRKTKTKRTALLLKLISDWIPDSTLLYVKEKIQLLWAIGLIGFSGFFLLALFSYSPQDPSLNTALNFDNDPLIRNLGGAFGAILSDISWQYFGLSALIMPILLVSWSVNIINKYQKKFSNFKLFIGVLAYFFALCAFNLISLQIAPRNIFNAGVIGYVLNSEFEFQLTKINAQGALSWVYATCAFLSLSCFIYVSGLSIRQWGSSLKSAAEFITPLFGNLFDSLQAQLSKLFSFKPKKPKLKKTPIEPVLGNAPIIARDPKQPFLETDLPRSDDLRPFMPEKKASTRFEPLIQVPPQSKAKETKAFLPTDATLPPTSLLAEAIQKSNISAQSTEHLKILAAQLEKALKDFGVTGVIEDVNPGPVVTLFQFKPAPGTKSSKIIALSDDLARTLLATSVRVAVIPGKDAIGIELPNKHRETVFLRELIENEQFFDNKTQKLSLILGKDISGAPIIVDLARMPHLLIAGTTGSGKSVGINTMILSLLYRLPPEKCRFIMIDPKMLELSVYENIPHLLSPVVTDPKKAILALKWTVREMENRYRAMAKLGVRNIDGYNERLAQARQNNEILTNRIQTGFDPDTGKPLFEDHQVDLTELPYIVVIVDEMADLMLVAGKDIEAAIQRLAQMARAAGIHIIMATQRPSVDVITGTIKANFPTRISFQVTSKIDSRTILGEQGAEQLLGQGDMLYMAGGGKITRVHGPFASDREVEQVVDYLKKQGRPTYVDAITEDADEENGEGSFMDQLFGGEGDDNESKLYSQAVGIVLRDRKASTSYIQRCLQIGYNRAARLIDKMEADGIVSQANHVGKREILKES